MHKRNVGNKYKLSNIYVKNNVNRLVKDADTVKKRKLARKERIRRRWKNREWIFEEAEIEILKRDIPTSYVDNPANGFFFDGVLMLYNKGHEFVSDFENKTIEVCKENETEDTITLRVSLGYGFFKDFNLDWYTMQRYIAYFKSREIDHRRLARPKEVLEVLVVPKCTEGDISVKLKSLTIWDRFGREYSVSKSILDKYNNRVRKIWERDRQKEKVS